MPIAAATIVGDTQLAQYGIAYARVDVRGSGDSDGIMVDEYAPPELNDGVAVIAWLARQPWSNGSVGMRGISWGGINTLQVAAMAPPELKAIMPMGCCDIRYTDDAHYIGGALGLTNFQWGVGFKGVMSAPPDPEIVGPDWAKMWRRRVGCHAGDSRRVGVAPALRCVLAAGLDRRQLSKTSSARCTWSMAGSTLTRTSSAGSSSI